MGRRNDHSLSFELRKGLPQRAAAYAQLLGDILLPQRLPGLKYARKYCGLQLLLYRFRHQCRFRYLLERHLRFHLPREHLAARYGLGERQLRPIELCRSRINIAHLLPPIYAQQPIHSSLHIVYKSQNWQVAGK